MTNPAVIGEGPNTATGWAVSRAVLYFGVASVVVVWASAFTCLMCHCLRRRRRGQAAADASRAQLPPGMAGSMEGAPRYFPTALPVVIVNPDNVSLELGIKEEASCGLYKGAAGDSGNAGGTGDGKAAPSPPPGAAAAGGRPALQRDSRGFMVWPQPQQHWQQQPWEQPQWQQEQRGIQLGQAKVWVPGDKAEAAEQAGPRTASVSGDDGASCSGSSMASTSSDARGAWGYQAPS